MNRSFVYVMFGLLLGVVLGTFSYYSFPDKATAADIAKDMALVSTVFLKLIKMIIGPLVLSTLVVGIGHMGDAATVGRVGAKTMGWFVSASIVSLLLGLFMVDLLKPGVGIVIADQSTTTANLTTQAFSIDNFIDHMVPTSVFKSLADGEILQIVVFSVFAGIAIMGLGERGKPLLELADGVSHMMLNITGYVMKIAPIAVCASVASVITKSGPGILINFAKFLGGFYLTLASSGCCSSCVGRIVIGAAHGRPGQAHARAVPAGVLDRELRSLVSENSRTAPALRGVAPNRQLRAAARLFVQPRRDDGLYDLRLDVHRPGLWRSTCRSASNC